MKLQYLHLVDKIINKKHLDQFDIEIAKNVLDGLENFSEYWIETLAYGKESESLDEETQHAFAIDMLEKLYQKAWSDLLKFRIKETKNYLE